MKFKIHDRMNMNLQKNPLLLFKEDYFLSNAPLFDLQSCSLILLEVSLSKEGAIQNLSQNDSAISKYTNHNTTFSCKEV